MAIRFDRSRFRRAMVLSFLLIGAIFIGCKKPAAKSVTRQKVHVVATAYPLADIARQVAGAAVQCDWIAEQGQSLDAIDPTSEIRAQIRQAEMVLTSGTGEEWAVEGFDDPMRAKSVIRLDLLQAAKQDSECRQLWLDPAVSQEAAGVIAERLALKQPEQAATFRQNA